jgi:hypothetical protein
MTNMTTARQRLAKHFPERYSVNKNRRPLLGNVFGYHGIIHVLLTRRARTKVLEPFKAVITNRFAEGYKRRAFGRRPPVVT